MYRCLLILLYFLFLLGCDNGSQTVVPPPAAAAKAWTAEDIDSLVQVKEKSIYSPAPTENGQPPPACDYIRYLSLVPNASYPAPDAILLLSPGMDTGMGALSHLGKNLIYAAKTYHDANIEVLIAERRGNCLEDLTGVNAAEASRDITTAIDYYYNAKPSGGKVFEGFITSEQAPYLSEFGVKLNIEDIYKIITTEVPDPETRRQKLFLAGHSISGFTLSIFAAWDFDGNPSTINDAGYRNCAGFVALDTLISTNYQLNQAVLNQLPKDRQAPFQTILTKSAYQRAVANLRNGKTSRIFAQDLLPESYMLAELAAMLADWAPDQESTLLSTVPYSENSEAYLRFSLAGTARKRNQTQNDFKRVRCTNLALSGMLLDDNFFPIYGWALSMGFLSNGTLAEKNFPFLDLFESLVSPNLFYPIQKKSTVYHWVNFDEYQTDSYSTMKEEVVDIHDYIKTVYSGPSNYYEWYFPNRQLIDVLAVGERGWLGGDKHYQHTDFESKVPILKLFSEHGIVTSGTDVSKHDHILLEGYTHFDIILAAANRLERRPNEVIDALIDFMLSK